MEEYIHDFNHDHPGAKLETFNIDSREGAQIAELYGVMEYPAIVAISNDGSIHQQWQGVEKLPLMNDLAYFATQ